MESDRLGKRKSRRQVKAYPTNTGSIMLATKIALPFAAYLRPNLDHN